MVTGAYLDLLIVGSGVAGLSAAVRAVTLEPGLRVGVLSKCELADSATQWAQGGVAAALAGRRGHDGLAAGRRGHDGLAAGRRGHDTAGDSPELHLADTLAAGAGLCDADAVRVLVTEGPDRVRELVALGAVFDRGPDGALALAREGGHSTARVVHAGGAATGAEIERALVEAVRRSATAIWEGWFAADLCIDGGVDGARVSGIVAADPGGTPTRISARHILLATGGAGQLFSQTTNPRQSTGDGLAMALRAGVACADVEFVQFHPTALAYPGMPRPLLSEALRGEGAVLRDVRGERFVDELAPRDVVSAAMTARMLDQGADHLWLDARGVDGFAVRFPSLAATLAAAGLDAAAEWLPVAPAAHYLCGGVLTDLDGATGVPGLWAAGEVACSGVHGANRLASNSLLEGMVFAARVVEAIVRGKGGPDATGALRPLFDTTPAAGTIPLTALNAVPPAGASPPAADAAKRREGLQKLMTADAGVVRDDASLAEVEGFTAAAVLDRPASVAERELNNLATVGHALAAAARARTESRGTHRRSDFPDRSDAMIRRFVP
ncbi:MAG TPA: FAD-binding protein [Acidimicrobiales bacterium]|nr:FAD-binding protein [Acidimicrobiales bacterium]